MATDRLNQDGFDDLLARALQRHSEPVPADFTQTMSMRIRQAEQQRILARIVLQQKLALAGCIILAGIATVAAAFFRGIVAGVFRSIAAGVTEQSGAFADAIPHTVRAFGGNWQLYTIFGAVSVLAVYSLVGLLVGDRLRMA